MIRRPHHSKYTGFTKTILTYSIPETVNTRIIKTLIVLLITDVRLKTDRECPCIMLIVLSREMKTLKKITNQWLACFSRTYPVQIVEIHVPLPNIKRIL